MPADHIMLRNNTTKMCAEIPGRGKGHINGQVQQDTCHETGDNQIWNLGVRYPKGGPAEQPLFQIRNVTDQFCMDLPGTGPQPIKTPVHEFTCDGTKADNQLWWIDKQKSGAYWIRNFASNNKCLNVGDLSTGGIWTKLTIFDCLNTDDQEWLVIHPSKD